MREVTESELKELKTGRVFPSTAVYDAIAKIEVGASLLVESSEWNSKTDLGQAILVQVNRKRAGYGGKKFSTKRLRDGTGWVVSRKV